MQVKYFTLYGDDFYSIWCISKPSLLFKKKPKNKTNKPTDFSISSPHPPYITDYLRRNWALHFLSNTNIYLHSFKWGWIFWLTGFLFLFYKEKDMVVVKLCIFIHKKSPYQVVS